MLNERFFLHDEGYTLSVSRGVGYFTGFYITTILRELIYLCICLMRSERFLHNRSSCVSV